MADQRKQLKILACPMNAHGHINACHGLCDELRDRGHQVIFLVDKEFAGKVSKYGFEEQYVELPEVKTDHQAEKGDEKIEFWQSFVLRNAEKYSLPPLEQWNELLPYIFKVQFEQQCQIEEQYKKAIEEIKPDLIITDCYICCPAIVCSGTPWVWLFSASPQAMIGFDDPRIPPFYSGLPYNGDKKEWEKFRQHVINQVGPLMKQIHDYQASKGVPSYGGRLHPYSPYLSLYMWPREMRYPELEELPPTVIGVDGFVRNVPDEKFELPEKLRNKPGRLIFLSMGSFGSSNLKMMLRLVDILSKSPHRFIVSKGPLKYDLPDNMYGERFLPQTAILQMVDLVMTHGGNNTVTETFYYGKKMLVLPIFADQFDNAQRITEVGLGARADPFRCSSEELLGLIEKLLADDHLTKRMARIGERIRIKSNDKQLVADSIEKIVA